MEASVESLPQMGKVSVTIEVAAEMRYSAEAARRLAGRFAANEISYLLRAGEPTLLLAQRMCWRVPLVLALPTTGPLDEVGAIDVDVETGQLTITPDLIEDITRHAERLVAEHTAPAGATL
ncbi:MAG: hypothetical protein ACLFTI_02565 [Anaerolineales bacterium]